MPTKKVYTENTELFNDWKNGTATVDFGDYQSYLDGAILYSKPYNVSNITTAYPETVIGCINADCMNLAESLIADGYNPAILNLASAGRPGGGYDRGKQAQEESLCHCSNLSLALYQYGSPARMKCITESGVPLRKAGYPLDMNFGGVYVPDVTFFRNTRSKYFTYKETPFKCDVITVAALSFSGRSEFARACEQEYRAPEGGFTPDGTEIMLNKIRTIFRMGVEHGNDSLILGAFGCGAYKLPSEHVAPLFRQVMNEPEFAGKFRLLVFAILEPAGKPNGLNGKFAPFYREFGSYTPE